MPAPQRCFPECQINDQQKIAFGAPVGFAAATAALIPEVARTGLRQARPVRYRAMRVGRTESIDALQSLNARLGSALPGFSRLPVQGNNFL